jgi:hypothetical protein
MVKNWIATTQDKTEQPPQPAKEYKAKTINAIARKGGEIKVNT